jgi:hypothetical protein
MVVAPARHVTQPCGIGSLESILGLEQSMGTRNRVGIGLSYQPAMLHTTQACGIGSLESILGLLKSLKIRFQSPLQATPAIICCHEH